MEFITVLRTDSSFWHRMWVDSGRLHIGLKND